jgi:hypothetical protein
MCVCLSYKKKIRGSLKSLIKEPDPELDPDPDPLVRGTDPGSAPKYHGSPTLPTGISAAATPAKKRAAPLLTPSPPPLPLGSSAEAGRNGAKVFCPKEEPVVAAAASGLIAPKFKAGTGRHLPQSYLQCCGSGNWCLFYPCGSQNKFFSDPGSQTLIFLSA